MLRCATCARKGTQPNCLGLSDPCAQTAGRKQRGWGRQRALRTFSRVYQAMTHSAQYEGKILRFKPPSSFSRGSACTAPKTQCKGGAT